MPDEAADLNACRKTPPPLVTREQAVHVMFYVEGWLWGAEHERASEYLRKAMEEIADQMVDDECAVPD